MRCTFLITALFVGVTPLIPGCALPSGKSLLLQESGGPPIILASDFGDAVPLQDTSDSGGDDRYDDDRTRPLGPLDRLRQKPVTTQPGDTVATRPSYTSPTSAMTSTAMLGFFVSATDASDPAGRGRAAAEAAVMSAGMPAGLPGVTPAAQPAPGRIIGQVGLQEGAPLFGASINNTRFARPNRVDPNCHALTRAGFFGGSFSQCRAQFRR